MSAGNPREEACQNGELTGQQRFQHAAFCVPQDRFEFWRLVADLPPDFVERLQAAAVGQHMGDCIHPLVAGGAVNAGKRRQLFVFAENFLDHHIEGLAAAAMRVADQPAQALKILDGIAQAIDVVEPQPLQLSFRDQPFDQPMNRLEGACVLDAQARQRIDVEEAPVVDVAGSKPPMTKLVMLAFEQVVQRKRRRGAIRPGAIGR